MTEIVYQDTVTDGVHASVYTEYKNGNINLKVTGPSEENRLKINEGTICAEKINISNLKDAK